MQFHSDGQTFKVVYITGPTHNLLGLAFKEGETSNDMHIEQLVVNTGEIARLSADEVHKWVLEGIKEANGELGTNYSAGRIQFVVSDSPPATVYRMLAKRIIYRLHTQPNSYNGVSD